MRFFDFSATALATVAMLSGASAAPSPDAPAAAPAYSGAPVSSATTTYYVTRTVLRVVETVTATHNGSASVYETTASSTATAPYYGSSNTTVITGTGGQPSATYVSPPPSTGSAGKLAPLSFVAALGLLGLAL